MLDLVDRYFRVAVYYYYPRVIIEGMNNLY
jgi:hypothetical protein